MDIAFLIVACLAQVFTVSFLIAAVFTFATFDRKPLDRDTEKRLSLSVWFGGGWFACVFAVTRCWHRCRQGRRFFYIGIGSGMVAVVFGCLAVRA